MKAAVVALRENLSWAREGFHSLPFFRSHHLDTPGEGDT
jgi:hypothetical protein